MAPSVYPVCVVHECVEFAREVDKCLSTMPAVRKYRRDTSEVSCCLKYVIFGFNVMFWWLGLGIMAVGVWAWTEKDTFNNLSRLTNVALDPAFILILVD